MKTLVSALVLLSFLSACEQMAMDDSMAMEEGMEMEGETGMDDGMETMADG